MHSPILGASANSKSLDGPSAPPIQTRTLISSPFVDAAIVVVQAGIWPVSGRARDGGARVAFQSQAWPYAPVCMALMSVRQTSPTPTASTRPDCAGFRRGVPGRRLSAVGGFRRCGRRPRATGGAFRRRLHRSARLNAASKLLDLTLDRRDQGLPTQRKGADPLGLQQIGDLAKSNARVCLPDRRSAQGQLAKLGPGAAGAAGQIRHGVRQRPFFARQDRGASAARASRSSVATSSVDVVAGS